MNQKECLICHKLFDNGRYLSAHLKFEEHITGKDYYDIYLKSLNEGICVVCKKPTTYVNFTRGYTKCCSQKCNNSFLSNKGKNISNTKKSYSNEKIKSINEKRKTTCMKKYSVPTNLLLNNTSHTSEIRKKAIHTYKKHKEEDLIIGHNLAKSWKTRKSMIDLYCKENDCTTINDLISIYGQGWLHLTIPKIYVNKQNVVISNEYIPIIQQYYESNQYSNKSKAEQYIIDNLDYNDTIIHNDRSIIKPKELDIYLPNKKLAIEYNGLYWHSINIVKDIHYHRNKSIACRKLGIRLIHIYEFEDLDNQINLINQLINGIDNFKDDFNKNNLIDIPDTIDIIYEDKNYTIYGA